MQPVIPANAAPKAALTRNTEYRYPWSTLLPGACFEFSPHAKLSSARVQCSTNGANLGRKFRCFRGVDGKVYAQRMDGFVAPPPSERVVAPMLTPGEAPAVSEDFGTFGDGCEAANGSLKYTDYGAIPESKKTEIERRMEEHQKILKRAATPPDQDVI